MASCGCKLKPPQSYLHSYYGDGLFQCNSYLPLQILFSKYFLQNSTITHCTTYLMFLFSEKRLENILRTLTTPCQKFRKFLEDISPSCRASDIPVMDFLWDLSWVSKPERIPHLRASSPACNRFLRFTSGATPADYLVNSMAAQPFDPHTCTRVMH